MSDKPIPFTAPMVRAILAGTKTQTRRISGLSDVNDNPDSWSLHNVGPLGYMAKKSAKGKFGATFESREIEPRAVFVCPQQLPYAVGDRLYVREHWRTASVHDKTPPRDLHPKTIVEYIADGGNLTTGRFRQGMHMPRWASRITLEVTDVRVERLQDISDDDAIAEGIEQSERFPDRYMTPSGDYAVPVVAYRRLWDHINGEGAWDENPWVAAYSFRPIFQNIDSIKETDHG